MFEKLKFFTAILFCALPALALAKANPEKIYILANSEDKDSETIARYYCKLRNVPEKNIIKLKTQQGGLVSKADYFSQIENPLIEKLTELGAVRAQKLGTVDSYGRAQYAFMGHDVDYIVICRGIPWGVEASAGLPSQKNGGGFSPKSDAAAVDSELSARFLEQPSLEGTLRNPLFGKKNVGSFKNLGILRVTRLDGASLKDVINQLDGIISAEKNGLRGRAYIDKSKKSEAADKWLDECANILKKLGFDTDVDEAPALFGFGHRMDNAAFYYGWYSFKAEGFFASENFKVSPGGIAMHIYSFSALNLRGKNEWCSSLIASGAGISTGNVYEPFLGSTHRYNAFMIGLASGLNAGETAYMSLPSLSWQGVFLGDPLYMPFKKGLDAQIADIESGVVDELSQYSVIRKMNLMKNEGKNISEISSYGASFLQKLPKPAALYWKLSLLSEEAHDANFAKQFAIRALDCELAESPVWQGLAMEINSYLERNSQDTQTLNKIMANYAKIAEDKNIPMPFKYLLCDRMQNLAKKCSIEIPAKAQNMVKEVEAHKEAERIRLEKIRKEKEAAQAK